jgi:DNA-binding response OmpR family regulator
MGNTAEDIVDEALNVLVIEDDPTVGDLLEDELKRHGYEVTLARDGRRGLALLRNGSFDAVVLDVMLPSVRGFDVARRFREDGGRTPILMLTARDALPDRLAGFDAGADDYLVKPFAMQELVARLKAVSRRRAGWPDVQRVVVGDLVINRQAHEAAREGRALALTPREFALLEYLATHSGKTLSRTMIMEHVWGHSVESFGNVVDVTVGRLRKAVDEGFDKPLIQTVRGVGYKLKA